MISLILLVLATGLVVCQVRAAPCVLELENVPPGFSDVKFEIVDYPKQNVVQMSVVFKYANRPAQSLGQYYLAVGLNPDGPVMPNAEIYDFVIQGINGSVTRGFTEVRKATNGRTRPPRAVNQSVIMGAGQQPSQEPGTVRLTLLRTLTASPEFLDLKTTNQVFLLAAAGKYANNDIQYHAENKIAGPQINLSSCTP
eukprot:CAMPEP_0184699180 /NCGR_PEP_ID=MMETSP0313-20130426/5540_1 /TAXON_ID=2792 /ORGANISM="Porphyridium aerugineum, Strain SAG 1380-2" /LENGTH=196 /DNA_ID=CAMNT_0027158227 /DNA_START=315 /DNA_END=905 /DNA_ORIENTATION=+